MNVFLVCVTRWMLATFWLLRALQQSESAIVCQVKPDDPTIVVLGETNAELGKKNAVSIEWDGCSGDAGETIQNLAFQRQRPDSTVPEEIASRRVSEGGFTMIAPFEDKLKYDARYKQKLNIFNVERNDEYVYTLEITYDINGGPFRGEVFQVKVDVKVPPEITVTPNREVRLSSLQNYTLTCNASGDPRPNITWTKAGVPASQFNASGYLLHLVDVQKEDAGSYICTASNGFGENATAIALVNIRCTGSCQTKKVGIRIPNLAFKESFRNEQSVEFQDLESSLLSAIWGVYADNPGKQLYRVDVQEFMDGSVYAFLELVFGTSTDPLTPLQDEMRDGTLGLLTVEPQLDIDPTTPPPTETTETTTEDNKESPSTGARGSGGLSEGAMWGIIGACIAFVIIVFIIILVCCICRKRSNNKGASKGGKSYSEADGYRMNRQPPPSGLGTASPAYVEARQYAPVTAARRQDDQSKPPQNYADLSFNNSSGPAKQPPPYSRTEYSEMMPEKRQPPAGGQQGEGGGFELWC